MSELRDKGEAVKNLRIVWVYLDHGAEGRGVDQGELPEAVARELYSGDPNDPKLYEEKPDKGPLTYEHVIEALKKLDAIFKDVGGKDPRFMSPWPESNPCEGGRPKYRP
jgi:hypothetical protein